MVDLAVVDVLLFAELAAEEFADKILLVPVPCVAGIGLLDVLEHALKAPLMITSRELIIHTAPFRISIARLAPLVLLAVVAGMDTTLNVKGNRQHLCAAL